MKYCEEYPEEDVTCIDCPDFIVCCDVNKETPQDENLTPEWDNILSQH